jgi:signal transduction histidine kinase
LKVVLKNLLGNAIKFTDHGSVRVDACVHAGGIQISVADTGIGIAPEALPIIFEPFRQADSSMTRRHRGVGLGLYIVHQLLELLDGKITVDSELGRGSTFRVWVPCDAGLSAHGSPL